MTKRILIAAAFTFTIFFLSRESVIWTFSTGNGSENLVRVCVAKDTPKVSLKVKGPYKITTLKTDQLIEDDRYMEEIDVLPVMSGIKLGDRELGIYGIKITPKRDATVYVNNRRFRGTVDIIRTEDLKLLVINHIDVEDYLRGVLYHEVSHWWPMEVLKAQAITARTYALYQKRVSKDRDYDLTSDVYSQVYGGKFSEKWRTDRAVKATKGKVLTYKGDIFPTYYHATCGGHTEDASNLWNIDIEPLKGTKCSFCKGSPHYYWKKEIPLSDIETNLKKEGYKIGTIKSIRVTERTPTDRASQVQIKSPTASLVIPGKDFRRIVGNNILRSANFKLNIKGNKVLFEGYGWGHGVGMCQWGAYFMAKRHYKVLEILRFYYPGTWIENY